MSKKTVKPRKKPPKIRLPREDASYAELSDFFDRHDGADLLDQGIMEIDQDREDLDRMRREAAKRVNSAA